MVPLSVFVLAIFNLLRNTFLLLQFLLDTKTRGVRSQFRWRRDWCYRFKIPRLGLNCVLLCHRNNPSDIRNQKLLQKLLWQLDLPFYAGTKHLDHKLARNQRIKLRSNYTLSNSISRYCAAVVLPFQLVQNIWSVCTLCRLAYLSCFRHASLHGYAASYSFRIRIRYSYLRPWNGAAASSWRRWVYSVPEFGQQLLRLLHPRSLFRSIPTWNQLIRHHLL